MVMTGVAGALAAALGFALASRGQASEGFTPLPIVDTATPTVESSPTLTLEPSPTTPGDPSPTATSEASPTLTPEPSATVVEPTTAPPPPPTAAPPPTATPSDTPVPPTATPSDTPVPPTATATVTPEPPTETPVAECDESLLRGGFGRLYNDEVRVRVGLGCPVGPEVAGEASEQFFERGTMYWWGRNGTRFRDTVFVLFGSNAGSYTAFSAEQVAALDDPPPQDDPNAPQRGFGSVYFNADGVAERLGRWISSEISLRDARAGVIQFFDRGVMLYTPMYTPENNASIFVLYDTGDFARYVDPLGG